MVQYNRMILYYIILYFIILYFIISYYIILYSGVLWKPFCYVKGWTNSFSVITCMKYNIQATRRSQCPWFRTNSQFVFFLNQKSIVQWRLIYFFQASEMKIHACYYSVSLYSCNMTHLLCCFMRWAKQTGLGLGVQWNLKIGPTISQLRNFNVWLVQFKLLLSYTRSSFPTESVGKLISLSL